MLRPSCFATFSEEEILAANKAVLRTSTKKETSLAYVPFYFSVENHFLAEFAAKRSPEPVSIKTKIKQ